MNFTQKAHSILIDKIKEGDIVVDATMGNGFDTLFLSEAVGENGFVYAFDIQDLALKNTKQYLKENAKCQRNVKLLKKSHEYIYQELKQDNVEKISVATFNLGYLPKSPDKEVKTMAISSIRAMEDCIALADKNSFCLSVLCYLGHSGAIEEYEAVKSLFDEKFSTYLSFRDENNTKSPVLLLGDVKNLKKNV